MLDRLQFNADKYEIRTCKRDGITIKYRAFMGIVYCDKPVSDIQKFNLFVPEVYYEGKEINGYGLKRAPIFIPNTVGGYMEGGLDEPGEDFLGRTNTIFKGLLHGYVIVAPGIRGRNTGLVTKEFFVGGKADDENSDTSPNSSAVGKAVGRAPALIVDMKAIIRYLRHNKAVIPGNADWIITSGTSAGGALSSLAGATGNASDYEPFLKEIGAAEEKDDIFAANCYCPIHNLENADSAYEWLFNGYDDYHKISFEKKDGKVEPVLVEGRMSPEQVEISADLKKLFPTYLNSLGLKDKSGNLLTLDENGEGSFKNHVKEWIISSAQKELDTHDSESRLSKQIVRGSEIERQTYFKIEENRVLDMDWDRYVEKITRMKPTPAFDSLELDSPENEEFGDSNVFARHFTAYGFKHSKKGGAMAEEKKIKLLNPIQYIGEASTAKYWRIRHGAFDRDTSLAIPVILATLLQNKGYIVDFALPWGLPHCGDYDTEELFKWIDEICEADKGSSL